MFTQTLINPCSSYIGRPALFRLCVYSFFFFAGLRVDVKRVDESEDGLSDADDDGDCGCPMIEDDDTSMGSKHALCTTVALLPVVPPLLTTTTTTTVAASTSSPMSASFEPTGYRSPDSKRWALPLICGSDLTPHSATDVICVYPPGFPNTPMCLREYVQLYLLPQVEFNNGSATMICSGSHPPTTKKFYGVIPDQWKYAGDWLKLCAVEEVNVSRAYTAVLALAASDYDGVDIKSVLDIVIKPTLLNARRLAGVFFEDRGGMAFTWPCGLLSCIANLLSRLEPLVVAFKL